MRFWTSLFAALVLSVALANAAQAQAPGASGGSYSVYGPYSSRASTGTYSVFGPYSERYSSPSSQTRTSSDTYSSLRTPALLSQTGAKGSGQGDVAARPDAGRAPVGGGPGTSRPRYVRISIAGNAIQGIVIP